jgi:hypothetical protein
MPLPSTTIEILEDGLRYRTLTGVRTPGPYYDGRDLAAGCHRLDYGTVVIGIKRRRPHRIGTVGTGDIVWVSAPLPAEGPIETLLAQLDAERWRAVELVRSMQQLVDDEEGEEEPVLGIDPDELRSRANDLRALAARIDREVERQTREAAALLAPAARDS